MASDTNPDGTPEAGVAHPDPERVQGIQRITLRREVIAVAILALTLAAMVVSLWSFGHSWMENRRLEAGRHAYQAEVVEVSRSNPAPDQITVRFSIRTREYERTISSSWFSRFRSQLEGRTVTIFFDSVDKGIARLSGEHNYPPAMVPSLILSALGLTIATYFYRTVRWHAKASHGSRWERARVAVDPDGPGDLLVRRPDDEDAHRATITLRRPPRGGLDEQGGWLARYDRGLVILADDPAHWFTASVGWSSPMRETETSIAATDVDSGPEEDATPPDANL